MRVCTAAAVRIAVGCLLDHVLGGERHRTAGGHAPGLDHHGRAERARALDQAGERDALDEVADGRYPDLRPLRKRDELQEFFGAFEEAINALKHRDQAALQEVESALDKGKNGDLADEAASEPIDEGSITTH